MSGVDTFQAEWELEQLVAIVERLEPEWILEIGAWQGGTLFHWLRLADSVVVIDDEMRGEQTWRQWEEETGSDIYLLQGMSQDERVVQAARELQPFDFIFIDADHRYESVVADWENYGPMSKVVAFHDIYERPGYGVSRLWAELKSVRGARCIEICQNEIPPGAEGRCGIGVLWQT